MASLRGLHVEVIPIEEHDADFCSEEIELWRLTRHPNASEQSGGNALEPLHLEQWGDAQPEVRGLMRGIPFCIEQHCSALIGQRLWGSSVVLSRFIMHCDCRHYRHHDD